VQSGDEREGIEMQGGAMLVLQPVICWRRDRGHAGTSGRNHGLISFVQGRAAPGDQPIPFLQLCNALWGVSKQFLEATTVHISAGENTHHLRGWWSRHFQ
jgi:hypothetical protein